MEPARAEGACGRRKGGATLRLRGRDLTSRPALRRAVARGHGENSARSRERDCSTSSVVHRGQRPRSVPAGTATIRSPRGVVHLGQAVLDAIAQRSPGGSSGEAAARLVADAVEDVLAVPDVLLAGRELDALRGLLAAPAAQIGSMASWPSIVGQHRVNAVGYRLDQVAEADRRRRSGAASILPALSTKRAKANLDVRSPRPAAAGRSGADGSAAAAADGHAQERRS